jgi:hypothetical protein
MLRITLNKLISVNVACMLLSASLLQADFKNYTNYLVSDIQTSAQLPKLPDQYYSFKELKTIEKLNYTQFTSYESTVSRFLEVLLKGTNFSIFQIKTELLSATKRYNINPCFVLALLTSSVNRSHGEQANLFEIFQFESNKVLGLTKLMKLGRVTSSSLNSEIFFSQFLVRYVSLLKEVFLDESNLIILAWHLGFEELKNRLSDRSIRELYSFELSELSKAYKAYDFCEQVSNSKNLGNHLNSNNSGDKGVSSEKVMAGYKYNP